MRYSLAASQAKARSDRARRGKQRNPEFQSHFGPAYKGTETFQFHAKEHHARIDLRPVRRTVTGEGFLDPAMVVEPRKDVKEAIAAAVTGGSTNMPVADRLPNCAASRQEYAHAPDYTNVSR